ncbi:neuropeptide-like precursor 1 [Cylas formicarius]|uniref:neuropeptide-like precursor 1 n=1 Tax=Cylas formicarius TaxID=197179 RepID=UPI00295852CD|nr:neuropeptide-like precursor 1 [Cylas formicarius]
MGAVRSLNFAVWYLFVASAPFFEVKTDGSCDIEVTETLRTLLNPQENDSMQVQALRRQLLRKFQEALDFAELEDDRNYKRNLASLAAWNNLPDEHKRNLEALARSGTWYKTLPDTLQSDDTNYKRSIANLAKNGQLPLMFLQHDNQKRGIEALARNGDLLRRQNFRDIRDTSEDFYDKRNLGSLMRNYNYPIGGGFGKRSVSSLARLGELPYYPKRNIQSLARDRQIIGKRDTVDNFQDSSKDGSEKRNIQSIKAQYKQSSRNKRQADLSYFDDNNGSDVFGMYQTGKPYDYDDLLQDLTMGDVYSVEGKRFLGSLAKSGWLRTPDRDSPFASQPEKRHVAALARLGWLPSYRSVRRYTRSGRSTGLSNDDMCRETPANGKTQNYSHSKITQVPLENKRYLLQPAVDNIILRKMFTHPRMTLH